jgi:hypothetical protein
VHVINKSMRLEEGTLNKSFELRSFGLIITEPRIV